MTIPIYSVLRTKTEYKQRQKMYIELKIIVTPFLYYFRSYFRQKEHDACGFTIHRAVLEKLKTYPRDKHIIDPDTKALADSFSYMV